RAETRQFAAQRNAEQQRQALIPVRCVRGVETAERRRNIAIIPRRCGLNLNQIAGAVSVDPDPGIAAWVRRRELGRHAFTPRKALRLAVFDTGETGDILRIVEQVTAERDPEINEQRRKERRGPTALQSFMKRDIEFAATQPVNPV